MEVKDLRIGDLVLYVDKEEKIETPCKIHSLNQNGEWSAQILNSKFIFQGNNDECPVEECLLPIPLTKEILLKNGFKDFSGGGCIIKELDDNEIPTLYIWDGNNSIYVVNYYSLNKYTYIKECKYVYEFQHELKSCGIKKEIVL